MLYYKVKKEYDGTRLIQFNKKKNFWFFDRELVKNELYTENELKKYKDSGLTNDMFDIIKIPKSKIYWFFGARFEKEA